jgi:hypothetical protein
MDWAEACRILGVAESATEAEMKEQYMYKAQLLHPDKNQDKPEKIRNKAEAELALVNQAYSFVNNPNNNPYKIPPKLAVEPMGIRFRDVDIGEKKSTTLIVRNTGGPYTSIWIDNQPAPWLTVAGVKSIGSERLPLEVALECVGTGEPGKQYVCELLIKLENESTHAVDNAAVKIELYIKSESARSGIEKEAITPTKKSGVEVPQDKPAVQPVQKKKMGFSLAAFLVNFLAFAIIGIVAVFVINIFWEINQMAMLIGLILYTIIAFGISFNHGFTVGSKTEKTQMKNN